MAKREKTSVSIDPELEKLVRKRMPDFDMGFSDAIEDALKNWLAKTEDPSKTLGTKVKFQTESSSTKQINVKEYFHKLEQARVLISAVLDGLGGVAREFDKPPKQKAIDIKSAIDRSEEARGSAGETPKAGRGPKKAGGT